MIDNGVRGFFSGDIVHHDIGAGLSQANSYALADARVCAGDQRFLPRQQLMNR
jgi:hypothetical protein